MTERQSLTDKSGMSMGVCSIVTRPLTAFVLGAMTFDDEEERTTSEGTCVGGGGGR